MYTEECLRIGYVENGFMLEVILPEKPKKSEGKDSCCIDMHEMQKKYFFKTAEEVGKKVSSLLPLMANVKMAEEAEEASEDAFEDAFNTALEEMKK